MTGPVCWGRFHFYSGVKEPDVRSVCSGTLGRQGSTAVMDHLEQLLQQAAKQHVTVLLSEVRHSFIFLIFAFSSDTHTTHEYISRP